MEIEIFGYQKINLKVKIVIYEQGDRLFEKFNRDGIVLVLFQIDCFDCIQRMDWKYVCYYYNWEVNVIVLVGNY